MKLKELHMKLKEWGMIKTFSLSRSKLLKSELNF